MHYSGLLRSAPLVAVLAVPSLALPHGNLMNRADNYTLNQERADAVKAAFVHAWTGYKKYAFPNDELHPVSNTFSNSRYSSPSSILGHFDSCLIEMAGVQVLWTLLARPV
jgi:mannosyl-oligosaccharide alpha-1,2-mannosidase